MSRRKYNINGVNEQSNEENIADTNDATKSTVFEAESKSPSQVQHCDPYRSIREAFLIRGASISAEHPLASATLDPLGVPHYFGPIPNYANSPLPSISVSGIALDSGGSGYPDDATTTVTLKDIFGTGQDVLLNRTIDPVTGAITGITLPGAGPFNGYTAPAVVIENSQGFGIDAAATATIAGPLVGGIRKFIDSLPTLGPSGVNGLGQYIPIAKAEDVTISGENAHYYEIAVVEYKEQMHPDLPPTTLRGYVQLETANVSGTHYPLTYPDGTPIKKPDGSQVLAVDKPHYMGPQIIAIRDKPVRIKFTNYLPKNAGGDLFLPVDTTVMGSGEGPNMFMPMSASLVPGTNILEIMTGTAHNLQPEQLIMLCEFVPETYNGDYRVLADSLTATSFRIALKQNPPIDPLASLGHVMEMYTQNRSVVHLHGGFVPWISDGTPHQWITPSGEVTSYPDGVSMRNVPDMFYDNNGNLVPAGTPGATNDPGIGSMTYYYNNQQSARLMFYHDHSYGITRLNVYAGEAAGYLITDQVEQDLINGTNVSNVNIPDSTPNGYARVIPSEQVPLIIQDRTFVDQNTIAALDPTWNWGSGPRDPVTGKILSAKTGDLWYPHVYMPNQNPALLSGMNDYGRWVFGPWFWPPTTGLTHPPIPNPYAGQSPVEYTHIPATPNPSSPMEAFMDTPIVNGAAYPYLNVEPKAYRFRILNACDDRFLNLQWYVADPAGYAIDGNGSPATPGAPGSFGTEVKMVPASQTPGFPQNWPTDGRAGGVPDPLTAGPQFVQVGTEGGFLPAPVVLANVPVQWNLNPTNFDFGNVNQGTLILGTAERADVIVDFSLFAGQTLILYNDAPAPFPAIDSRYDYYTDNPDQTGSGGSPPTRPGYGPNTRTIMQVRVGTTVSSPSVLDLAKLKEVFKKTATKRGVFEASQDPVIVPNARYNSAYNKTFPPDTYVRIFESSKTFPTVSGSPATVTLNFEPKAMHDEMGGAWDPDYGRMVAALGLEIPGTTANTQIFTPYPFASPPVEIIKDSVLANPIGSLGDGTQIWKITHNGVDTHTIHVHLFNAQLINRVAWDNAIRVPDDNELGWKETFRISPLQDTIIALRPVIPTQPFKVPNSIRLIDPTMPDGVALKLPALGWRDPSGQPVNVVNHQVNFGWEYMWHCHILAHEEMDMMHAIALAAGPEAAPDSLQATATIPVNLSWRDNSVKTETGFIIERATDQAFTLGLTTFTVGQNVTAFKDRTVAALTRYWYRVQACNVIGDNAVYASPSIGFPNITLKSDFSAAVSVITPVPPAAPTNLTAKTDLNPKRITLTWFDRSNNENGFNVYRSTNGGEFLLIAVVNPHSGMGIVTYWDQTVVGGNTYSYRVTAFTTVAESSPSNTVFVIFVVPAAPTSLAATFNAQQISLSWIDSSDNENGFYIFRSTNGGAFVQLAGFVSRTSAQSTAVGGTVTFSDPSVARGNIYRYYTVAFNAAGLSAQSNMVNVNYAVPTAPSNLSGSAVRNGATDTVTLNWVDNSDNESGFLIQRAVNSAFTLSVNSFSAAANAATFSQQASRGLTYYYRIRANNPLGNSAWSNTVQITTP